MPTRKKAKKRKQPAKRRARKKSAPRKRKPAKAGQATNSQAHTDYNRNHVEIQVGTAQQSITRARRLLEDDLSKLFIRKRNARTKTDKRKIGKKMREISSRINRLK